MKKIYLLLFISSSCFYHLAGQNNWSMGPTLLLGFSGEQSVKKENFTFPPSISTTTNDVRKILPAFGGGWWVAQQFDKKWSLRLGGQYIYTQHYLQTEQTISGTFNFYELIERKLTAHQFQFPLQLQYTITNKGGIKPYFTVGGNTSYSLSLKQKIINLFASNGQFNISLKEEEIDFDVVFPSDFDRLELNWIYSLGVEFERFSIELNRSQATVLEMINDQNAFIDCFIPCPSFEGRKIHTTMLSIKYEL